MAQSTTGKIIEGIFAIDKPPYLSSAQVLRDLGNHFKPSRTFAPLVEQTRSQNKEHEQRSKRRRYNANSNLVKLGHGGTLDPMATGVLIVGVGKRGTKRLPEFLGCKKTYETVVLFGKSTDTYDIAGKIVADAPFIHITQDLVAQKIVDFRGKIKQTPPIYSALRIDGMHAYDYARTGKELPRELQPRDMEVDECKILEWYDGGTHEYRWPAHVAKDDEQAIAERSIEATAATLDSLHVPADLRPEFVPISTTADNKPNREHSPPNTQDGQNADAALHTHEPPSLSPDPSPAAAVRIRLTVSSGFYVRSFAHDLGLACGSLGIMASLVRTQQADFTSLASSSSSSQVPTSPAADTRSSSTPPPPPPELMRTLTYADLAAGEASWGPKVEEMISRWARLHPEPEQDRIDGRDRHPRQNQQQQQQQFSTSRTEFRGGWARGGNNNRPHRNYGSGSGSGSGEKRRREGDDRDYKQRRRNSSSPE